MSRHLLLRILAGCLTVVCAIGFAVAEEEPPPTYTTQDLTRLFGPAAETAPSTEVEAEAAEVNTQASPTYTTRDLLRLFGPASETAPPTEEELEAAEANAESWAFVRDFLGRQHAQNESDRQYELDRLRENAEADLIDRTKTTPGDGYGYPVFPRYPYLPVPRPEPKPDPRPDPGPPADDGTTSPDPRLDRTYDRLNQRRERIEQRFGGGESGGDGGRQRPSTKSKTDGR